MSVAFDEMSKEEGGTVMEVKEERRKEGKEKKETRGVSLEPDPGCWEYFPVSIAQREAVMGWESQEHEQEQARKQELGRLITGTSDRWDWDLGRQGDDDVIKIASPRRTNQSEG